MVVHGFVEETLTASPEVAEAIALKKGLQQAQTMTNGPIIMESGTQRAINAVNNRAFIQAWQISAVLADIRQLTLQGPSISFIYAPHSANLATDWLVKLVKRGMYPLDWVSVPPPPLKSILTSDRDVDPG